MAEDTFTLAAYYTSWQAYQGHIAAAIAPLTAEQLALRAAPHLRSIGELALHLAGCRAYWLIAFMGEDGGEEMQRYVEWNEAALRPEPPIPPAAELVEGLERTQHYLAACLARWSPEAMRATFPDEVDGKQVAVSRAWVIWHILEHYLHHGGELSLTLGLHG